MRITLTGLVVELTYRTRYQIRVIRFERGQERAALESVGLDFTYGLISFSELCVLVTEIYSLERLPMCDGRAQDELCSGARVRIAK